VRRFFVDSGAALSADGRIAVTDAGDVRHIVNVLRMKPGDALSVSDGTGRTYVCTIDEIGDAVYLTVCDIVRAAEPRTRIVLYQCVPKRGKTETVIQKSTELGAVRFVPVFSERSVPKPKNLDAKLERWQRVAEEASKQSGRAVVPVVDAPLSLAEAIRTFGEYDLVLFPYENEDGRTIKDALRRGARGAAEATDPRHIAVIIGPEGGFTDAEACAIEDAGAVPCSLGGTILRTETAGPAAIAMILYEREL
jgi:16S rRNA (uracil1498-N3)-methyltransferase